MVTLKSKHGNLAEHWLQEKELIQGIREIKEKMKKPSQGVGGTQADLVVAVRYGILPDLNKRLQTTAGRAGHKMLKEG